MARTLTPSLPFAEDDALDAGTTTVCDDDNSPQHVELPMQYKTIALELLRQKPEVCDELSRNRMLLQTMNAYAAELKSSAHHLDGRAPAGTGQQEDERQIASEALEIALKELTDRPPSRHRRTKRRRRRSMGQWPSSVAIRRPRNGETPPAPAAVRRPARLRCNHGARTTVTRANAPGRLR